MAHPVRQCASQTGGPAKETERMKKTNSGGICLRFGICDRNRRIEENAAVEMRIRQDHGIGVNWQDDVCPRGEILAIAVDTNEADRACHGNPGHCSSLQKKSCDSVGRVRSHSGIR